MQSTQLFYCKINICFNIRKIVFVLTHGVHHQALLCKRMMFKYLQFSFLHKRSLPYNYHMLQL